jgi:hypothetical protein
MDVQAMGFVDRAKAMGWSAEKQVDLLLAFINGYVEDEEDFLLWLDTHADD